VLPEQAEKLPVPAEKRFWLNKEESLFPSPNHPGQQHEKNPIRLPVDRAFDLTMEDDELLS
jgi:hypothetical protein